MFRLISRQRDCVIVSCFVIFGNENVTDFKVTSFVGKTCAGIECCQNVGTRGETVNHLQTIELENYFRSPEEKSVRVWN